MHIQEEWQTHTIIGPKRHMKPHKLDYLLFRILSYLRNIPGAEIDNIQFVQSPNQIATTIRAASEAVDQNKAAQRKHIPKNPPPKDYARQLRNQCQPLRYADKLLQHMVPYGRRGERLNQTTEK